MNDITGAETIDGTAVLIELDEASRTIRFLDDEGGTIATYALDTFATVTGALALNVGASIVVSADTVAGIRQWARLD